MAILLYPEVFIQPALTEYLLSAKISAGCRNQKIISHPPWHWGIHQLITEEKILHCHVISDIIEKRIKCNGNTEEKGPKGEIFMSFQPKFKPEGWGKFLQAQTGVGGWRW